MSFKEVDEVMLVSVFLRSLLQLHFKLGEMDKYSNVCTYISLLLGSEVFTDVDGAISSGSVSLLRECVY